MDKTQKQILDNILEKMRAAKGFPSLVKTITAVMDNLHSDTVSTRDIAEQIAGDVSLTQKVLKLVSSPMYSSFGKEVTTITHAIQVLGVEAVTHLVLSVKVLDSMADGGAGIPELSNTLSASDIAKELGADRAEESSIATMIFNLGALMVASYLPEEHAAIKKLVANGMSPDDAALEVIHFTYAGLGHAVAVKWKFPTVLADIVHGKGDPTIIGIAKFSNAAAPLIKEKRFDELQNLTAQSAIPGVGFEHLVSVMNSSIVKSGIDEEDIIKPSRRIVDVRPVVDIDPKVIKRVSELNDLEKYLTQFRNFDVVANKLATGLNNVMESNRCLISMRASNGEFRTKAGFGKGLDMMRSAFRLPTPTASVFNVILQRKREGFVPDVREMPSGSFPDWYDTSSYKITSMLLFPLLIDGEVAGVVYLDWPKKFHVTDDEKLVMSRLFAYLLRYVSKQV